MVLSAAPGRDTAEQGGASQERHDLLGPRAEPATEAVACA